MFGLEVKGIKNKENQEYVENLLKKYNLYDFKDKYPSELSGGMRQRVALIRTLAIRPKVLLLDEAFSALDYQTRIMVTNDIYQILRKENITAIIVTHDISEGRFQSRHPVKYAWKTIWIQIYSIKKYGILAIFSLEWNAIGIKTENADIWVFIKAECHILMCWGKEALS